MVVPSLCLYSTLCFTSAANMVDTSPKVQSTRIAMAEAIVQFQPSTFAELVESNGQNAKGAIFTVSRIAGICGSKRTSDLIPLCHPLSITHISIRFKINKELNQLLVYSRVKTVSFTGVEMEALTACSVAALTIYDMCKALSHDIVIGPIRLCGKTGGKANFGCVEFDADHNYF
uniref:cyclic pyranopterin monophosphate synthase n=1 Tax=Ditylenchus dipsaci TaxID=166011 RepID=A0A915E4C6_9BILA